MLKTLQGQHTKLNKKGPKRRQSVVAGRQQVYCAVQSRSPIVIVKRRPEKYSLQLATERRQRRCFPDRWQAVPHTCRSHWEGTVANVCANSACVLQRVTTSNIVCCFTVISKTTHFHCCGVFHRNVQHRMAVVIVSALR